MSDTNDEKALEIHNQSTRRLSSPMQDKIFVGYGPTFREARANAEGKCQTAGCHTPGGKPYACDCGHSTSYMLPN